MPLGPYVKPVFDNRASTRSLSDLIRSRGDLEAQRQLQRGDSAARMWGAVGQAGQMVGQSLADLREWKANEPFRKEQLAQIAERQTARSKAANLEGLNQMAGAAQMAPEQRAGLLEREGYFPEAEQARAMGSRRMSDVRSRITANATVFGKGAQILREVQRDPSLYAELQPALVDLASSVHPDLGKEIPPTYEPERIKGLLQFAADAQAEATKRAADLKRLDNITDAVKRVDTTRKTLAGWLESAKTEADWNANLDLARAIGVEEADIAQFGPWGPDAPARAAAMVGKEKKDEAGFTLGRNQVRYDPSGKVVARGPLGPEPADGASIAQRGAAERWKANALKAAEEDFAQAYYPRPAVNVQGRPYQPEYTPTQEQQAQAVRKLDAQKAQIQRSYQAQLGVSGSRSLADLAESKPPAPAAPDGPAFDTRTIRGRETWVPREAQPAAPAASPAPSATATPSVPPRSKGVRARADVIARGQQLGMTPEEAIADATARGYLVR